MPGRGRVRSSLLHALIGCCLLASTAARGDVVVLDAAKDNTLYESVGDSSNGIGDTFIAGRVGSFGGFSRRRAILAFDVAGSIPAGSTVQSAKLTLLNDLPSSSGYTGPQELRLHRALVSWGEGNSIDFGGAGAPAAPGDATWFHRFYDTVLWTGAVVPDLDTGGAKNDFISTASAVQTVDSPGFYEWESSALAQDVQTWVDHPNANLGWIVIGPEPQMVKTVKRFASRENPTASNRPKLTVVFTPCDPNPCALPTGACCATDAACTVRTEPACEAEEGLYQGDGTTCDPTRCAPPTGACCARNGTCSEPSSESACGAEGGVYQGDGTRCSMADCQVILDPFEDPLPILAVARPLAGDPGQEASYQIAMREFQHQFHHDLPPTTVWGYGDGPTGGTTPGPTIEASRSQRVTVTWFNDLRDPQGQPRSEHYLPVEHCVHGAEEASPRTVVHVHGAHVSADSDGYPEDTLLPGQQDVYYYPNGQLPATLWYHDHALGITRLNVYMGLVAFYLIRDEAEKALGLPAGEFEIPLAIQDRTFKPDGSLSYPVELQDHFFGDKITVNGKVWPLLQVKQGKYRFRLLNASNSRAYRLGLSGGLPFHQIGTDGGLLPAPIEVSEITLLPAERSDVVIDFAGLPPGTEVLLTNSAPAPFPGLPGEGVIPNVMKFVVMAEPGHTASLPQALRPFERLQEDSATVFRNFDLNLGPHPCKGSAWLINGLHWDDITEFPVLGTTEVWSFINRSGMTHPMHLHLVQAQILDRQSFRIVRGTVIPTGARVPPAAQEAGWKDTYQSPPGMITRVIARFESFSGKFAHHCHILEHEDHEMMRQFQTVSCGNGVTEPGEECDDGNLDRGDGCSPSCGRENLLEIFGFARGGEVRVTIEGVPIVVATAARQRPAQVVSSLADAINNDPVFQEGDVYAGARGNVLATNGTITDLVISDPGLSDKPIPNQPPVARAGADRSAECTSPEGARVNLDGSDSVDPDSTPGTHDDILLFEWFEDFGQPSETPLGSGEHLEVILPLGEHPITLRVTDSVGESATDRVTVSVVDTTPPDISVQVVPSTLWPPNHQMVEVVARVTAQDACGAASVVMASVSSNEPDDAPGAGDGNTDHDIQDAMLLTPDYRFKLRAERSGSGGGRVYEVIYTALDGMGNAHSANASVTVPRSQAANDEGG